MPRAARELPRYRGAAATVRHIAAVGPSRDLAEAQPQVEAKVVPTRRTAVERSPTERLVELRPDREAEARPAAWAALRSKPRAAGRIPRPPVEVWPRGHVVPPPEVAVRGP